MMCFTMQNQYFHDFPSFSLKSGKPSGWLASASWVARKPGKPRKSEKKQQKAVFFNAKSIFFLIFLVFMVFGYLYKPGPSRLQIFLISMKNKENPKKK